MSTDVAARVQSDPLAADGDEDCGWVLGRESWTFHRWFCGGEEGGRRRDTPHPPGGGERKVFRLANCVNGCISFGWNRIRRRFDAERAA
jgi:hypothetical protein